MNTTTTNINKDRKQKPSILDPFLNDIKYYYDLGINTVSISKIMNEKTPIRLSVNAYRHFIETRLKSKQ